MRLENIERLHLALLALVGAIALLTRWFSPGSVLLGGAVMGGNFWIMRQVFRHIVGVNTPRKTAVAAALLLLKFTIFMALLGLLFWRVPLDALGFGVGATVLLVACVAEALRQPGQLSRSY